MSEVAASEVAEELQRVRAKLLEVREDVRKAEQALAEHRQREETLALEEQELQAKLAGRAAAGRGSSCSSDQSNPARARRASSVEPVKVEEAMALITSLRSMVEPDLPGGEHDVQAEPELNLRVELVMANCGKRISGGTVHALVEAMTSADKCDQHFSAMFLLTYQTFVTPQELLAHLKHRFENHGDEPANLVRVRVLNTIVQWIRDYFHDFENEPSLLCWLVAFAEDCLETDASLAKVLVKLCKVLQRKLEGDEGHVPQSTGKKSQHRRGSSVFRSPLPSFRAKEKTTILEFKPKEIAEQMTIISWNMFRNITAKEFFDKSWLSKKGHLSSEMNIFLLTNRFNVLAAWVQFSILQGEDAKRRASIWSQMIHIQVECIKLRNFADAMAILGGLTGSPVDRLKQTREQLSRKDSEHFAQSLALLTSESNYAAYRNALESPCVPFLGVAQKDLNAFSEKHQDWLPGRKGEVLNFHKRYEMGNVVSKIMALQQGSYDLTSNEELSAMLSLYRAPLTERELDELSLQREPRAC